jgi:diguanylate cyclase
MTRRSLAIWHTLFSEDAVDPHTREELGRLLFTTIVPKTIVGISLVALAAVLHVKTGNDAMIAIGVAGLLATVYRVACVLLFRRNEASARVATWERAYGVGNFWFALVLAAFSFVAVPMDGASAKLMAAILVVGFCAGIVGRASVRPWIAIPTVLISAGSLALATAMHPGPEHLVIAAVLVAMTVGSFDMIVNTYNITLEHLTTRQRFAEMAGEDSLTRLPNRSMLHERLDALFARKDPQLIAIHFVDLDHFKAINDTYGHAAGDIILVEVAKRMRAVLTRGAFAARLGGDEFVIVQPNIDNEAEAQMLSRDVVEAISWPIFLPHGAVNIQVSDGCCIVETTAATGAEAMAAADAALYEAKRDGRGRAIVRGYRPDAA